MNEDRVAALPNDISEFRCLHLCLIHVMPQNNCCVPPRHSLPSHIADSWYVNLIETGVSSRGEEGRVGGSHDISHPIRVVDGEHK